MPTYRDNPFGKKDIEDFAATGDPMAKWLYGMTAIDEPSGTRFMHRMLGIGFDDQRKTNDLIARFTDFLGRRDKTKKEHEEYLKLSKERPGRKSSILVPTEMTDREATLLGTPATTSLLGAL